MGKYFSILLIVLLAACISCSDAIELGEGDYMVFGQFNGFCGGESCVDFFRLETDRIFEEKADDYSGQGFHPFNNFVALTEAQFEIAKDLESKFPTRLLVEPDSILGDPNVIDAGSLYFEWKTDTEHRYWIIHKGLNNILPEYAEFSEELSSLIDQLNLS